MSIARSSDAVSLRSVARDRASGGGRWTGRARGAIGVFLSWTLLSACEETPPPGPGQALVNPPIVVGSDTLPAEEIRSFLAAELGFTSRGGEVFCSYTALGREGNRVFLATMCEEFVQRADSLESGSGRGGPVALVLDTLAEPIRILAHHAPGDGDRYLRDIREIFPEPIQRRILTGAAEHDLRAVALRAANYGAAAATLPARAGR